MTNLPALFSALAGIAVAVFLLLTLAPVSHSFEVRFGVLSDLSPCKGPSFPDGVTVTFRWTSSPPSAGIGVWSCSSAAPVAVQFLSNDSGRFVSDGGAYDFGAMCPDVHPVPPVCPWANVTGTYLAPLIGLP